MLVLATGLVIQLHDWESKPKDSKCAPELLHGGYSKLLHGAPEQAKKSAPALAPQPCQKVKCTYILYGRFCY